MSNKSVLEIKGIEGHIVLLCKNNYKYDDFLVALRRLWAIRCGYDYEHNEDGSADEYIADELFRIFKIINPEKAENYYKYLHREFNNSFGKHDNLKPLEICILSYRSEIAFSQVKERVNQKYRVLIKLPKPKKRVFNRIFKGGGKYGDYKIINA